MYDIGDKIAYPMHGAGIIEAIEEKEILGEKHNYYILKMPIGDMKVMIPVKNTVEIGVRDIIKVKDVDKVLDVLRSQDVNTSDNWNKRYRENMIKIKSGDIFEVAEVVRTLMLRDNDKGLSTGERKMLASARQILISELVLVKDMEPERIEEIIDKNISI